MCTKTHYMVFHRARRKGDHKDIILKITSYNKYILQFFWNYYGDTLKWAYYISYLSPVKSCELDPLPTWLLKECKDELVPLITDIVNMSLRESMIPKSL